jgi:cell division protein FtsZ
MYCTSRDVFNINEERAKNFLGFPRICVLGCGIVGNNILNRLAQLGLDGAETIALSTDKLGLTLVEAEKKILILSDGFGYGCNQNAGKTIFETDRAFLETMLRDFDMVFVATSNVDGMCTEAAAIVAEISKKNGAIVVGMISSSMHVTRAGIQLAEINLETFRKNSDALIEIDQNRLLNTIPHLPLRHAVSIVDQIIAETIKGIAETLTQPSLINIDFADLRTIMKSGGNLLMSVGEADLRDDPKKIVRTALGNPFVNLDYHGAVACLLHITGGADLTLRHAAEISSALAQELDPGANIIWGAKINPTFLQKVRVTTIAKGARLVKTAPN